MESVDRALACTVDVSLLVIMIITILLPLIYLPDLTCGLELDGMLTYLFRGL